MILRVGLTVTATTTEKLAITITFEQLISDLELLLGRNSTQEDFLLILN